MTEKRWTKDTTPYYVFSCPRCNGFLYLKKGNKSKTCTRCGAKILSKTITVRKESVVYGMSNAVLEIKKRQNQIAISQLGGNPDLKAKGQYQKKSSSFLSFKIENNTENEQDLNYSKLKKEIFLHFQSFNVVPAYSIEMICEKFDTLTVKEWIARLLKENIIEASNNNQYSLHFKTISRE